MRLKQVQRRFSRMSMPVGNLTRRLLLKQGEQFATDLEAMAEAIRRYMYENGTATNPEWDAAREQEGWQ